MVHTEEEEDYVDEPPLPAISEVTKAGAKAAATGVSLVSALSSSITDGWSALETMLADKPPGGDKDWCALPPPTQAAAGLRSAPRQARVLQHRPQAEVAGRVQLWARRCAACCRQPLRRSRALSLCPARPGDTVVQGRLYVFEQTICFYSTFVGNTIKARLLPASPALSLEPLFPSRRLSAPAT